MSRSHYSYFFVHVRFFLLGEEHLVPNLSPKRKLQPFLGYTTAIENADRVRRLYPENCATHSY